MTHREALFEGGGETVLISAAFRVRDAADVAESTSPASYTLQVASSGNGHVVITPVKERYQDGDLVTLEA